MIKKKEDPDISERAKIAHQIQQFFIYNYGDRWVSEREVRNQSRMHNQVFNELVSQGFIERKKTQFGYNYRWKAVFPRTE